MLFAVALRNMVVSGPILRSGGVDVDSLEVGGVCLVGCRRWPTLPASGCEPPFGGAGSDSFSADGCC